jgi:hypothetical protein
MTKLMFGAAGLSTLLAAAAALPGVSAAQAQSQAEVGVFGTEPCPRSTDSSIVICRRLPESLRYRMPEAYRPSGTYQERQSWANKAREVANVGATGTNTCSPVGPGGHTGCLVQEIQQARRAQQQAADAGTPPE